MVGVEFRDSRRTNKASGQWYWRTRRLWQSGISRGLIVAVFGCISLDVGAQLFASTALRGGFGFCQRIWESGA
jgi:hypothetical protein